MPAGISHPGFGYATFCAIKFAGYTAAVHFLSMSYDRDVSAWKVGAVRTLIGMAAGAAYFGLWDLMKRTGHVPGDIHGGFPLLYLAGLLPVRIAEWWLLICSTIASCASPPRAGAWCGSARYGLTCSMRRPSPASSPLQDSGSADKWAA